MGIDTVPEFLNRELLQTAIKSYKNDETIEIKSFEITNAFGEHFGSQMYRAKIDFKSTTLKNVQSLPVVIKILPLIKSMLGYESEIQLFKTEIEMYQKIIPAFDELYERNGQSVEFAPELIYADDSSNMIIILKDLTPDGYVCLRDPPKKIDDSKLLVEKLAKFHAASIYLQDSNQLDLSSFKYSIYDSEKLIDMFFRDAILVFREVVEEWEGYEEYLPKLDNLIANIGEIGGKNFIPNRTGCGFNVLNHGDFHLRNIIVKANEEHRIKQFYFIDFQLNVWCSPVVDLSTMMLLFRLDEINTIKDELVMFYLQELVVALKSIGYLKQPPTLLDLNIELVKNGSINIIMWIVFYPFQFVDWSKMKVEDMVGKEEKSRNFKKDLFKIPALQKLIKEEMKIWKNKGWW